MSANQPQFSNPDAEKHLLACVMKAPIQCLVIIERMGAVPEWFEMDAMHQLLYTSLREYTISGGAMAGHSIDTLVFLRFLHSRGHTHIGYPLMLEYLNCVPTAVNVQDYAEIVRDLFVVRRVRQSCSDILKGIQSRAQTAAEVCSELAVAAATAGLYSSGRAKQVTTASAADEILADIEAGNQEALVGLKTGFAALDEHIGGFQRGDMILIRGGRGSGKSAFALNLAEAYDRIHSLSSVYFTYEMTVRQQVQRLIQLRGRQNIKEYVRTSGDLLADKSALSLIRMGVERVKSCKIAFVDERPATIESLVQRTRIAASSGDLGLAVLDYDELLTLPSSKSKEEALSDISSEWKKIAQELGISTIMLSQITEGKDGHVKARWSQAKENFANIILTVTEEADGSRSVSIDKNRDGSRGGVVKFDFLGKICMFVCASC